MRILCPHCQNRVDVPQFEPDSGDLTCPSCDSYIDLSGQNTVTARNLPRALIKNFELIEQLGRGGFGTVFRVWDRELQRQVALKIPHDTGSSRENAQFLKEAQASAALDHPNIIPVFEIGRFDDRLYIVSQLVTGVSLSEYLSGKEMAPGEAATVCEKIARALQHAHDRDVVHRDIKPSNILLAAGNEPKIADFGLAKRTSNDITATADGQIFGTFAYMSPEQARGENSTVDGRADVYSLGVVLYQLLAGKRPFEGSPRLLLKQVLEDSPEAPRNRKPSVPPDLQTVCLKAMEKVPSRRYQTALEFADDLRRFLEGRPIEARPVSLWERGYRWGLRNKVATASICAALVFVAVTIGIVRSGDPQPPAAASSPVVTSDHMTCSIDTSPSGAAMTFVRLKPEWRQPYPDEEPIRATSPAEVDLLPGEYEVIVTHKSGLAHHVLRSVPDKEQTEPYSVFPHLTFHEISSQDRRVVLPDIQLFNTQDVVAELGMALIAAGEFRMGVGTEAHAHSVPAFYLQRDLVRVGQFRRVLRRHPAIWQSIAFAMPDLANRKEDEAVTNVSYDLATVFAELTGTLLPTDAQYEFAATNRGETTFPQGDAADLTNAWATPEGDPKDVSQAGVRRLFSGPGEWLRSSQISYSSQFWRETGEKPVTLKQDVRSLIAGSRVIRGVSTDWLGKPWGWKPPQMPAFTPQTVRGHLRADVPECSPRLGFRCVRR